VIWHYMLGSTGRDQNYNVLPAIINPGIFKIIQQIVSFFGLSEDWAFRSWGISAVRFSGYYGIIVHLAKLTINTNSLSRRLYL
jgi:hypothetical protein